MPSWTNDLDNIVLEQLRLIRSMLDDLKTEVREFNARVGTAEYQIAGRNLAAAGQSSEIDALKARLDRVERRLDLRD